MARQEFEMTEDDLASLMDACKPTPAMFLSGGEPMGGTPQENANFAWRRLGEKMGFDHMTVQPVRGKGKRVFTANAIERPAEIQSGAIHIVFDGPPPHESGRFVEVEDSEGHGISIGEWHERDDGLWELRIPGVLVGKDEIAARDIAEEEAREEAANNSQFGVGA